MDNCTLDFKPIIGNENQISKPTYKMLEKLSALDKCMYAEIDTNFAGGFEICEKYNFDPKVGINCLVVEARRGDNVSYAALLVPVGYKYNMSSVVRKKLNARTVSVAPLEYVLEHTGMEFGSINPVGLPEDFNIFIDPHALESDRIIVGSGLLKTKICIPSKLLLELPNSEILEGLAKEV